MTHIRRGALSSLVLVAVASACGDSTSPTPTAPAPPVVEPPRVLHDTLNPPGGTSNVEVMVSSQRPGPYETVGIDDFVSPVTGAIRTVAWQGIYVPADRVSATRFHLEFLPDNGSGSGPSLEIDEAARRTVALYRGVFSLAEVNQRLEIVVPCHYTSQCGLYDYSVTLPTPLPVTAGVRYWVVIQADGPWDLKAPMTWGWRRGLPDNQRSRSHIANATLLFDFAFALRQ